MSEQPREGGRFAKSHGMHKSAEYRAWGLMKSRCLNPNFTSYERYGGRGIAICERWLTFQNFFADMGLKPSPKHTLDRKDPNGNYEPDNCRWATFQEQQQNKTNNALTPDLVEDIRASSENCNRIAKRLGVSPGTVYNARSGKRWGNVGFAK